MPACYGHPVLVVRIALHNAGKPLGGTLFSRDEEALLATTPDGRCGLRSAAPSRGERPAVPAHQQEARRGAEQEAKEGVLTQDVQRYNNRIRGLQGEIRGTQRRLTTVQTELNGARDELLEVRDDLEVARDRLARARSELKAGRAALADRLVELYKADEPDALTVILEADGFADLLERTEFLERISDQDREIVARVKVLKARAQKSEGLLAKLEGRKQTAAETILRRRDDIASTRDRLASAQGKLRTQRNGRRTILASVREQRVEAEEDLAAMERAQAGIRNSLAGRPRPDQAGLRAADLSRQRNLHLAVRPALGPPARGRRYLGAHRHPDPRGRRGPRGARGLDRRLRPVHLHPAHGLHVHLLWPPVAHRRVGRSEREPGPGDRRGREHRQLHGPAPALRSADQREPRGSDGLSRGYAGARVRALPRTATKRFWTAVPRNPSRNQPGFPAQGVPGGTRVPPGILF